MRVNAPCADWFFSDPAYGTVKNCYVRPASAFARLNYMLQLAVSGKVGLGFSGTAYGLSRGGYYIGNGWFQTDIANAIVRAGDFYSAVQNGAKLRVLRFALGRFGSATRYLYGVFYNGTVCSQAVFGPPAAKQTNTFTIAN